MGTHRKTISNCVIAHSLVMLLMIPVAGAGAPPSAPASAVAAAGGRIRHARVWVRSLAPRCGHASTVRNAGRHLAAANYESIWSGRDEADGVVHCMNALEFLARWVHHVYDHYETRVRCYGTYATRTQPDVAPSPDGGMTSTLVGR